MSCWVDSASECFKACVLLENNWKFAHICITWLSYVRGKCKHGQLWWLTCTLPFMWRGLLCSRGRGAQGCMSYLDVQRPLWAPTWSPGPPLLQSQWDLLLCSRRLSLNFLWVLITAGDSFPLLFSCHPQPPKRQDKRECHCFSFLLWLWFPPLCVSENFKTTKQIKYYRSSPCEPSPPSGVSPLFLADFLLSSSFSFLSF